MMRRVLAGAALALALGTAACSGEPAPPGVASVDRGGAHAGASPTPSLSDAQQELNWVKCMRAHGIQMSDPDPAEGGVKGAEPIGGPAKGAPGEEAYGNKLNAAQAACVALAPAGQEGQPPTAQQLERERLMAQCLRGKGFNAPDPLPNGQGPPLDRSLLKDPRYMAAAQQCREQVNAQTHPSP